MIYERNVFDQAVRNLCMINEKKKKINAGQGYKYVVGYLLDYPLFKHEFKN